MKIATIGLERREQRLVQKFVTQPAVALDHARSLLADWQDDYNTVRPHSSIGNTSHNAAPRKMPSPILQHGLAWSAPPAAGQNTLGIA
jgi:hypothetical protein